MTRVAFGKPIDDSTPQGTSYAINLGVGQAPQDFMRLVPEGQRSETTLEHAESTMSNYQSNSERWGRTGKNFLVNAIGMGGIMFGANDPDQLSKAITGQEREYSNDVMDWSTRFMEDNREGVYEKQEGATNLHSLSDPAWWLNRTSELGQLAGIAAEGIGEAAIVGLVTGGLGEAGEALNIGRKLEAVLNAGKVLSKLGKERAMVTGSFAYSGLKEALTESNDSYHSVYQDVIAKGGTVEQAKQAASESAAGVFRANAALKMVTGALEARALTYSPIKGVIEEGIIDTALSKIKNPVVRGIALGTAGMLEEGTEEGLQFIFQEENKYNAELLNGLIGNESAYNRYNGYLRNSEFLNSIIVGAAGGAAQPLGGAILRKTLGIGENPYENVHQNAAGYEAGMNISAINKIGKSLAEDDVISANVERRNLSSRKALAGLHLDVLAGKNIEEEGIFNDHVTFLNNVLQAANKVGGEQLDNSSSAARQELTKFGATDEESINNIKKVFPKLIEDANKIKKIYEEEADRTNQNYSVLMPIVQRRFEYDNIMSELKNIEKRIAGTNDTFQNELSATGKLRKIITDDISSLNLRMNVLTGREDTLSGSDAELNNQHIEDIKKSIETATKNLENTAYTEEEIAKGVDKRDDVILNASISNPEVEKLSSVRDALIARKDSLLYELSKWRDKEFQNQKKEEALAERNVQLKEEKKRAEEKKLAQKQEKELQKKAKAEEKKKAKETESLKSGTKEKSTSDIPGEFGSGINSVSMNDVPPPTDEDMPVSASDEYDHDRDSAEAELKDDNNKTAAAFSNVMSNGGTYTVIPDMSEFGLHYSPSISDPSELQKSTALKAITKYLFDNNIKPQYFEDLIADMKQKYGINKLKSFYPAVTLGWNELAKIRPEIKKYSDSEFKLIYDSFLDTDKTAEEMFSNLAEELTGTVLTARKEKEAKVITTEDVNHVNIEGKSQNESDIAAARVVNFSNDIAVYNEDEDRIEHNWRPENKLADTEEIDVLALDNFEKYTVGKKLKVRIPENYENIRTGLFWSSDPNSHLYHPDITRQGQRVTILAKEMNGKMINVDKENPFTFGDQMNGTKVLVKYSDPGNTREITLPKIEKGSKEWKENIPMKIYDGDKPVAFIHAVEWNHKVRQPDVSQDIINELKEKTRELREATVSNGESSVTISRTTGGSLSIAPNLTEPKLLSEVNPTGTSIVGIKDSRGNIVTAEGKTLNIENFDTIEKINNGMAVILYPKGKNEDGKEIYHVSKAFSVFKNADGTINKSLLYLKDLTGDNDADKITSSIIGALRGFISGDLKDKTVSGKSFSTIAGVKEYVRQFISIPKSRPLDKDGNPANNVMYFDGMFHFVDVAGREFSIHNKTGFTENANAALDYVEKYILPNMRLERSLSALRNDLAVQFISKDGKEVLPIEEGYKTYGQYLRTKIFTNTAEFNVGTEENPLYTAFLQRTISMTLDKEAKKEVKETKEITPIRETIAEKKIEEPVKEEVKIVKPSTPVTKEEIKAIPELTVDEVQFVKDAIAMISTLMSKDSIRIHNIDDLNLEMLPGISDEIKDFLRMSINAVDGLMPQEQAEMIDYLFNNVVRLFKSSEVEILKNKEIDDYIINDIKNICNEIEKKILPIYDRLNELVSKNAQLERLISDYGTLLGKIETVRNNSDILTLQVKDKLNTLSIVKEAEEDEEVVFDRSAEEISHKQKASASIREFVGATYDLNKDGDINTGFLGVHKFVNPDEVYDRISVILADVESNFDTFVNVLEDWGTVYPWISKGKDYDLVHRLRSASSIVKNEFTTLMSKHRLGMKTPMYSGTDSFTVVDTNSNSNRRAIVKDWMNNIVQNGFVKWDDATGYYIFDKEKVKFVYDKLVEWSKNPSALIDQPSSVIKDVLDITGIELSTDMIDMWKKVGIRDAAQRKNISFGSMFSNDSYIFLYLTRELGAILAKQGNANFGQGQGNFSLSGNPVYNTAAEEAKFTKGRVVTSWRDGKKSIYGITQNTFTTHRTTDFKNRKLYEELNGCLFNANCPTLSLIQTDGKFADKFGVNVIAKTALKEFGKRVFKDAKITNLSDSDHELAKLICFQDVKSGSLTSTMKLSDTLSVGRRLSVMFGLTMSDKEGLYLFNTAAYDFNLSHFDKDENGKYGPKKELIDMIYRNAVKSEINRIEAHHKIYNSFNIKGYNPSFFYLIPRLNIAKLEDGTRIVDIIREGKFSEREEEILPVIYNELREFIEDVKNEKIASWNKTGIIRKDTFVSDAKYLSKWESADYHQKIGLSAYDFVINYIMHDTDMYKMYANDIANYFKNDTVDKKKKIEDYTDDEVFSVVNDTLINTGKRLAMLNAPGTELADSANNQYIQIFMQDNEVEKGNFYNYLKASKGDKYADSFKKITETDAQEYMTWNEFVYVIDKAGRLEDVLEGVTIDEFTEVKKVMASGKKLTTRDKALLKKVIQPIIKPVYTGQHYDVDKKMMRSMYVKSSAFVLAEPLTAGLEIDKLRIAMEEIEKKTGKTVRASYESANKVGAIKSSVNLFSGAKMNTEELVNNYQNYTMTMNRKNFRIQQDIPQKSSKKVFNEITMGTQMVKLMFSDGAINLDYNGVKGVDLNEEYVGHFKELIQMRKNNLLDDLAVDENGNFSEERRIEAVEKLRELLKEEADGRGYSRQDRESLEINDQGEFVNPIWLLPNADKIEALLHSVVSKKIAKVKMPGYSYVAGSEAGFRIQDNMEGIEKSQIVWTDEPINRPLNQYEVLVPCRYKMPNGKDIDLIRDGFASKYTDEKTGKSYYRLHKSKFSEELLDIISFRIPTSKHASMSLDRIVGFLPATAGDLMVLSNVKTTQKGLDFDVDKENTYHYAVELDEKGRLVKLKEKENNSREEKERVILNKIIDIQKKVLSHPEIREGKMLEVISTDDAKNNAEAIFSFTNKISKSFSPLSDSYQKDKMIAGASGKLSIGAYSLDVVLQSQLEQLYATKRAIKFREPYADPGINVIRYKDLNVTIGKITNEDGTIGGTRTLDGKRTIAEVLSERQNISTDNEKLQVLGKVNLNKYTLSVDKVLTLLGFDKGDEVEGIDSISFLLMSQPILKDYVDEMSILDSEMGDFVSKSDKDMLIYQKLAMKYRSDSQVDPSFLTNDVLLSEIKGESRPEVQLAVIDLFMRLKPYGEKLQKVQTMLNVDSKGLGISYFDTLFDTQELINIGLGDKTAVNMEALIGDFSGMKHSDEYIFIGKDPEGEDMYVRPKTLGGVFTVNTLMLAKNLWGKHFPYSSPLIWRSLNKLYDEPSTDKARALTSELKKFLYSSSDIGIVDNATEERKRLTIDVVEGDNIVHESLPRYINRIRNSPIEEIKINKILEALEVKIETNTSCSTMTFNNTMEDAYTEEDYYASFVNLLVDTNTKLPVFNGNENYTPSDLAQDMIKYAFLEGGVQEANQFVKYVPLEYLRRIGITANLNDITRKMQNREIPESMVDNFVLQFIRHNPRAAAKVKKTILASATGLTPEKVTKYRYIEVTKKELMPSGDYITVYDRGKKNKYHIYRKVKRINSDRLIYEKVSGLGQVNMSEYNGSMERFSSIVKSNMETVINNVELLQSDTTKKKETSKVEKSFVEMISNVPMSDLKSTIEGISLNGTISEPFRKLSETILKSEYVKNSIKNIEFKIEDNITVRGAYNRATNTIVINKKLQGDDFAKTVLHELIHALTIKKLETYIKFNGKSIESVNSNAPTFIRNLVDLFEEVRKNIDPKKFEAIQEELPTGKISNDSSLYYGGYNIYEFVTESLTNPNFQNTLSNIKLEKEYSLFDKFVNFVNSILESFGVKDTGALRPAIGAALSLIDYQEEVTVGKTNPFDMSGELEAIFGKQMWSEANKLVEDENKVYKKNTPKVEDKNILKGIEISSNTRGLGAALTNPTELAKKKGNIKGSYPVLFNGVNYSDAEEAYQMNKENYPNRNNQYATDSTYTLMVDILKAKLSQYPKLVEAIKENGGFNWLDKCTHQPTSKNSVWETKGKNWFIQALKEAYSHIQLDGPVNLSPSFIEEFSESAILLDKFRDANNKKLC